MKKKTRKNHQFQGESGTKNLQRKQGDNAMNAGTMTSSPRTSFSTKIADPFKSRTATLRRSLSDCFTAGVAGADSLGWFVDLFGNHWTGSWLWNIGIAFSPGFNRSMIFVEP